MGRQLLLYLGLSPSAKNARRVLESAGFWPAHANIEKYIMNIRDSFPQDALDEVRIWECQINFSLSIITPVIQLVLIST